MPMAYLAVKRVSEDDYGEVNTPDGRLPIEDIHGIFTAEQDARLKLEETYAVTRWFRDEHTRVLTDGDVSGGECEVLPIMWERDEENESDGYYSEEYSAFVRDTCTMSYNLTGERYLVTVPVILSPSHDHVWQATVFTGRTASYSVALPLREDAIRAALIWAGIELDDFRYTLE